MKVWIVEFENGGEWIPCDDAFIGLSEEEGNSQLAVEQSSRPEHNYRIACYERKD